MEPNKKQNDKPKKRKTLKIILTAVITLLVLLAVALLVIVPAYISSESGRKTILTKINESVAGSTDFASLSMSWFKGVKLTNFTYDDDFGQTSVRVKQISTKPHYASILAGNLSFGTTVVDEPMVSIDLRKRPAPATTDKPSEEKPSKEKVALQLPVNRMDLQINNGDVKVTDTKSNTIHLTKIDFRLDLKGPDRMNSFGADLLIADSDTPTPLHAEGTINPTKISGDLTVEVNNLQLSALAPLFDLANVQIDAKGLLSANIKTQFKDSKLLMLTGTATGTNIDVGGPALKGDRFRTATLDLDVKMAQQKDLMSLDKLTLTTDWAKIDASGKVPTDLKSLSQFIEPKAGYDLKGTIDVDLPKIANQMPNILKLEPGTTITSGKLAGNISRSTQADKAQIQADLRITDLAGLVDRKRVALSEPIEAHAIISSDKSGINFEKLQVTSSFAQLKCTGTEKLLAYEAKVDLQKLQNELGSFLKLGGYKTAGLLTSTGKITTSDDTFNLTGNLSIQNLNLTTPDGQTASEPQAVIVMDLDMARKTSDITIKNLTCNGAFGKIQIKNALLPAQKKPNKPLILPIDAEVDLAQIRPFAMLSSAYPKKLYLAGIATSKLRLTLDEHTTRIVTDWTQIQDFSYGTPKTGQVTLGLVTAKLDASFGAEKTAVKFDLANPKIKAKGNFNIDTARNTRTMTAKADCDYDWKFVSTLLSAFMSDELSIEGQNKTTVEFTTTYPADKPEKLLANMNTKPIKVSFDKAEYRGFKAPEPSQIAIQFNKGRLNIPKFSIKVNDGTFSYAGQADFNQEKVVLKLSEPMQILQNVKLDKEIAFKLLQKIFPIFSDAQKVSGLASFDCNTLEIPLAGADKTDLAVDGTFSVSELLLESQIFDAIQKFFGKQGKYNRMEILPTHIIAKNGLVRYDNMQLNAGNNPFNSVGRINLINKSIKGSLIITPYTPGRTVNIGQEDTPGRIRVPLKGTYDKPELDFSGLLQQNIGSILEETIKDGKIDIEGLKDIFDQF